LCDFRALDGSIISLMMPRNMKPMKDPSVMLRWNVWMLGRAVHEPFLQVCTSASHAEGPTTAVWQPAAVPLAGRAGGVQLAQAHGLQPLECLTACEPACC
jgi:hypothetical protein